MTVHHVPVGGNDLACADGPHAGLVWAQAHDGVIGAGGRLLWHLPEDLAHFRELTAGHTVVMGRSTWESLPPRVRPLPGRRNVVLSRSPAWSAPGALVAAPPAEALALAGGGRVWVIGGGQVYAAFLPHAGVVVRTDVDVAASRRCAGPAAGWAASVTGLRYAISSYRRC